MNNDKESAIADRYTVHWIDSMGKGYRTFDSLPEVRGWAESNGRVLGKAELHMPTFEVTTSAGAALTTEQLIFLQPKSSEETYQERESEARQWIARNTGGQYSSDCAPSMYDGKATAIIFKSGVFATKK